MRDLELRAKLRVAEHFQASAYEAGRESRQPEIDALRSALERVTGEDYRRTLAIQYDISHPEFRSRNTL